MHNRDIKLSIGLIVKNEEEYLDQCLESLMPLLAQIPSELLIADTGSNDRTIEIAKKYTNNIHQYEWEDDFAKARNFVLDRACGEWFLQVDADEKLESIESIVKFLNSEEAAEYNDVYILLRNYSYNIENAFTESYIPRFFRIQSGRRYEGIIHEGVPVIGPKKYLDVVIYHYGYIQNRYSGNKVRNKQGRNLPLLIKAVEQEPNDSRLLYHLAQEYVVAKQFEPAKEALKATIHADRDVHYKRYAPLAYWNLNGIFLLEKEYDKSVKMAERYFEENFETDITTLNILINTLKALLASERYEDTIPYFEKYFSAIRNIQLNVKQGRNDLMPALHTYDNEFYESTLCQYVNALQKCKKYEKALEKLEQVKCESGYKILNIILTLWLAELEEMQSYEKAADYYLTLKAGTAAQQETGRGLIMGFWEMDPESAVKIAKLIIADEKDSFALVQTILLKNAEGETVSKEELEGVLAELTPELYYEYILYLAISQEADISTFLEKCTTNRVIEFACEVYRKNYEVRQGLLKGKFQKEEYQSLKEVLFYAMLREQLTMDGRISLKQLKETLKLYADEMTFYVESLYRPEVVACEERGNLPDEYAFALYIYEALAHQELGDLRAYLSCLQEAVKACPVKNKIVKRLIEEVEEELEEQAKAGQEFEAYGTQVKAIIRDMIQKKNYAAAREAIFAYENVNPMDAEITEMKEKLGIYPC